MTSESKYGEENIQHTFTTLRGSNSGKFEWSVKDIQIIQRMLNATNKQLFESRPFIMAKLKWIIQLYPNGDNDKNTGSIKVYLKLLSMPIQVSKIIVSRTIRCNKTMASCTGINAFSEAGQRRAWGDNRLSLNEWKSLNLSALSISVSIKVNHIVMNPNSNYCSSLFLTHIKPEV